MERPRSAATNPVITWLDCQLMSLGPSNGIPMLITGNSRARLNQKMSWTSSGVPRKNQV